MVLLLDTGCLQKYFKKCNINVKKGIFIFLNCKITCLYFILLIDNKTLQIKIFKTFVVKNKVSKYCYKLWFQKLLYNRSIKIYNVMKTINIYKIYYFQEFIV